MPTFGEVDGISEDYDWNELEYAQMCNSDVVKALIGPFSGELTAIGFIAAPYGSLLRFAEGIDSVRNLAVTVTDGDATLVWDTPLGDAVPTTVSELLPVQKYVVSAFKQGPAGELSVVKAGGQGAMHVTPS